MSRIFTDLLAADALAKEFGVGLNPRLRDAIEKELVWPSKSSGPDAQVAEAHGENVIPLAPKTPIGKAS